MTSALCLSLLLLTAGDPAPRAISLAEALRLAARQNPDAAAARSQAALAAASVGRAESAWKPELVATGAYDRTTAPQYLNYAQFAALIGQAYVGLTPRPGATAPPSLALQAPDTWLGTVQVSQPFFSPQGLFGLAPAQAAARSAAATADDAREQVLLGVARAYLNLLGIEGLTGAARDALAVAQRRELDARAEIAAGSGTEVALLRAQAGTARARSQLAELQAARAAGRAALAALIGEPVVPNAGVAPEQERLTFRPAPRATSPWLGVAAVRAAKESVVAAGGALQLDTWAWLPTVAGVVRGTYNSNQGFYGTTTYADFIVSVSVPLYDRGVRYAAAAEDRGRLMAAQSHLEAVEAQAEATWAGAQANLEAAEAELELARSQAQLAGRTQADVGDNSRAGLATNLELSDADAQRFQAESGAAQAAAAVEVRRAELAAAEGKLFALLSEGSGS